MGWEKASPWCRVLGVTAARRAPSDTLPRSPQHVRKSLERVADRLMALQPGTKSVSQAFGEFQNQLTTLISESDAAKSHRASIESCLIENLGMTNFFQSGSFGNGTNIPVHSDVDRFAVFPRENLKENSRASLRLVARALSQRFKTTRGIRLKPPAVVVPFGVNGLETTEVIPAYAAGSISNHEVYAIPDPAGPSWILSCPHSLHSYTNEINAANNEQLKPLVRFVKAWKYARAVPVQSIYLQLACASFARNMVLNSGSVDLARLFNLMRLQRFAPIQDPFGVSDSIPASLSTTAREEAMSKVTTAANISVAAVTCELRWQVGPAFRRWKMLLGNRFPSSS